MPVFCSLLPGAIQVRQIEGEFRKVAALVSPDERLAKQIHFGYMELKDSRDMFMRVPNGAIYARCTRR